MALAQQIPEERPTVVALVRVSTEVQAADHRGGLPRQRAAIRKTIESQRLNCIAWYELHVSGTSSTETPEMKEILRRVASSEIKGVVVADLDRLFRPDNPREFAVLGILKDWGCKIYATDFTYNLDSRDGLLFSNIRAAISGFELSLIKDRVAGAKETLRRAGKCPSPAHTLPLGLGYDRQNQRWHYTDDIARVRELFRLYDSEGLRNYSELGRRFNLDNASVKVILRNPFYATGERQYTQKRGEKTVSATGKTYRRKVPRRPEEVIRVKILEPIVSQECFDRVQAEMTRASFNHMETRKSFGTVNMGAGLAMCGHCGQPLFYCSRRQARPVTQRSSYVTCKSNHYRYKPKLRGCRQTHLKAPDLDAAIIALGAELLSSPETLAGIIEASVARRKELISPLPVVSSPAAKIQDLVKRDKRLLDAFEAGAISLDELKTKRQSIRKEAAVLERLAEQQSKVRPPQPDTLVVARLIVKAGLRFAKLSDKLAQKMILKELLTEIHVRDMQLVSIRFRDSVLNPDLSGGTILLSNPVRIGPEPDVLPEGHRRCIKCHTVKPQAEYYRRLNVCNDCRRVAERNRHLRRLEKKRQAKGRPASQTNTQTDVGPSHTPLFGPSPNSGDVDREQTQES